MKINLCHLGLLLLQEVAESAPQLKRLRLIKKAPANRPGLALISCLESIKSSGEALRTLLRISDSFEFDTADIPEAVKRLSDHFKSESESAVRVKIFSLFSDLGREPGADVNAIIEETIVLLRNEPSHKVIAQGIYTVLQLGKLLPDSVTLHQKLVDIVKGFLKDVSHSVKCKCLEVIGALIPLTQGICGKRFNFFIRECNIFLL